MRTKKYLYSAALILSAFMFSPKHLCAQDDGIKDVLKKIELGVTFGANNFLGDLGGNLGVGGTFLKDYTLKTVRPLAGFSVAYYPQNWYQLKASFNYTSVDGADSLIPKTDGGQGRWRFYRNLSFNSHISEASFTGQFYPLTFFNEDHDVKQFSPFIEFGFGFFHFNPTTQLNGQTIDLQPLHLEGEGFAEYPNSKNYSLTQIYLPASIGLKYYLNNQFSLSVGATFRKTFTDYIDDVSENYIDPTLFSKYLSPSQAAIATQLYKRVLPQYESKVGTVRGFNGDDTYVTFFFSASFALSRFISFYYGSRYDRAGQLERQ